MKTQEEMDELLKYIELQNSEEVNNQFTFEQFNTIMWHIEQCEGVGYDTIGLWRDGISESLKRKYPKIFASPDADLDIRRKERQRIIAHVQRMADSGMSYEGIVASILAGKQDL